MKKFRQITFFLLAVLLLVQTAVLPAAAAETTQGETQAATQATESMEPVTLPTTEAEFGTVSVVNGCRTIDGMIPLSGGEQKLDTAQSAFLYEVNTDTVVYSFNPDTRLPAGSLTKLVTAIVALQYCELDDVVTVQSGIKSRLPVSSLTMDLTSEEQVTVRDLLYGLLLTYANDAAVVLAEHVAGNRQGFVPLMNQWVQQIGCTGTEFSTVHGVDGGESLTTARDMAKIVREATKNEIFREIFGATEYDMEATNKSEARSTMRTYNYMSDNHNIQQFYDTRVTGGVQVYESSSGACMAITATSSDESMDYIGVVMGCVRVYQENGWSVVTYGNLEEMTNLLKMGFNDYKVNRVFYNGMTLSQVNVNGGECSAVAMVTKDIDSVVPVSAQMNNLTMNLKMRDGGLSAPIEAGEQIGTVEIWYRTSCMAEAEVYAMGSVKASGDTGVTIRSTAVRSDLGDSGILSIIGTICVIVLGLAAAYLTFNAYMRSRIRAQRRRRRANRRRIR